MPQLLPEGLQDPVDLVTEAIEDTAITFGRTWEMHLGEACACEKEYPHLEIAGGRVAQLTGIDTLIQWIRLTLSVERFRHPIYSDDYGVEFDALVARSPSQEEVETEAPRTMREALGVDERVLEVRLVQLEPAEDDPSSYFVDIEVVTFSGDLETISTRVNLEEL